MEQKLQNVLEKDETLLWSGKPDAFTFMDVTHKDGYIKKWISIVAVCAVAMVCYMIAAAKYNAPIHPAIPGFLLFVIAYGLLSDRLDAMKLQSKTIYGFTDRRVLVLMGLSVKSVEYANIKEYTFDTDADGHTSLLCGSLPPTERSNQRRMGTVRGITNDPATGNCESVVMYALTDAETVNEILSQRIAA